MSAEPVPARPVTVEPPEHPLYALTTFGLSRYRRQLEGALKAVPEHAAVRELLPRETRRGAGRAGSRVAAADAPAR
jgi:hypothetical protein